MHVPYVLGDIAHSNFNFLMGNSIKSLLALPRFQRDTRNSCSSSFRLLFLSLSPLFQHAIGEPAPASHGLDTKTDGITEHFPLVEYPSYFHSTLSLNPVPMTAANFSPPYVAALRVFVPLGVLYVLGTCVLPPPGFFCPLSRGATSSSSSILPSG